ncbi:hypothetical protein ACFVR2_17665 [Gottfriedia sp. NPDC057991]|uniref:hypothetical protein n=1 Tax=Gottfriedia sp. NPDC057991 TaxID=3346298 RepID=UPI0036DB4CC3
MYRVIYSILSLILISTLIGCSLNLKSTKNNSTPDETTVPVYWSGPQTNAVSSRDIAICGKSKIAKKKQLPGFIMVKLSDEPITYRSTNQIVKFSQVSMIDTEYRLDNMSLWRDSSTNKELYIGRSKGNIPPKEVVVYKIGACS